MFADCCITLFVILALSSLGLRVNPGFPMSVESVDIYLDS